MTQEEIMIEYILLKVRQKDWHWVSNAANDLREMQAKKEKKEWVGLTDAEIKRIGKLDLDSNYFGLWYDFAKDIEAKLKEKNT